MPPSTNAAAGGSRSRRAAGFRPMVAAIGARKSLNCSSGNNARVSHERNVKRNRTFDGP